MRRCAPMRPAIAAALIGVVACGGKPEGAGKPAAAPDQVAVTPQGTATAQGPASPPETAHDVSAHWVLEAPGIRGDFQSPVRGDIWAGAYHRVSGRWIRPFDVTGDLVWVASPDEVWSLQTKTSTFYVSNALGRSATDLSKPGRVFTAVGDGWIAFADRNDRSLNGSIGLMRPSAGGFDEVPLPGARGMVTDVYEATALTQYGEVFSWNGSGWEHNGSVSHPGGATAMFTWTRLSGSGSGDLFATAWLFASQLAGSRWEDFSLAGHVPHSVWARPYGPRWAIGGGAAGAEVFEWDGHEWEDRGAAPGTPNVGSPVVGSDGIDVFVAVYDGIYRFVR